MAHLAFGSVLGAAIKIPPAPRKLPGAKGSLERRSWMLGRQMVMAERDGRDREVMQLADRLDAMEAEAEQRSPALLAKVQAAYMCGRWGSCS